MNNLTFILLMENDRSYFSKEYWKRMILAVYTFFYMFFYTLIYPPNQDSQSTNSGTRRSNFNSFSRGGRSTFNRGLNFRGMGGG